MATRARVFCASWADVFDDFLGLTNVGTTLDHERGRLWQLIDRTEHLDYLLLTKRPENIESMIPDTWREAMPPNVWLGCTVENQHYADLRIPHLLQHQSVVRFLSIEPQLGPVDLARYIGQIDWVICGGESGAGCRPTAVEWARSVRDQCLAVPVSFFFKQWGNHMQVGDTERLVRIPTKDERLLDGREWSEIPTPRMQRRIAVSPEPTGLSVWERLRKPQVG